MSGSVERGQDWLRLCTRAERVLSAARAHAKLADREPSPGMNDPGTQLSWTRKTAAAHAELQGAVANLASELAVHDPQAADQCRKDPLAAARSVATSAREYLVNALASPRLADTDARRAAAGEPEERLPR